MRAEFNLRARRCATIETAAVPNPYRYRWPGGIRRSKSRWTPAHAGWRLDRALAAAVPTLSRERLKALIRSGALDARRQARSATRRPRFAATSASRLAVPEPTPAHNEPQDIPLTIVFEDEHLLVVDKPAGLVVHPAAGNRDGTLVNALLHHCGGSLSGIGGVARPGIVHRIDKDTSGLLVVAKTDVAHEGLAKQFAAHIDRPALPGDRHRRAEDRARARSTRPLARSSHNRKKIAIVAGGRGKRAVTHWKRLDRPAATRRWSNAGSKPAGPTRSASTWPRSAIRCSAIRSTARSGKASRQVA